MVKNKDMQFFMENLKMKRKKGQKYFDLPKQGFEFSCEVRSPRSNQIKLLKEIGL